MRLASLGLDSAMETLARNPSDWRRALRLAVTAGLFLVGSAALGLSNPLQWPASEAECWFEGGSLLLTNEQERELKSLSDTARADWIERFLARDQ